MNEPLIVGIDPGNTSAVAAVDLNGDLRLLESSREFPPKDIIMMLIETGTPVVVSCDTASMSSTVAKIASNLGAQKFSPEEDLESERKKNLGGKGNNSHEKDAVASAMYAYNNLQKKIEKIRKFSEESENNEFEVARNYFSPGEEADINDLK